MAFRNVIFDFDHTLVRLGPHVDWRTAVREIEKIYAVAGIPESVLQDCRGVGFKLMRTVYEHMMSSLPVEQAREIQWRAFNCLESYEILGADKAPPMEGAANLLSWLCDHGYPCAIVSSNGSQAVERTLESLGLKTFVAGVFGRDPLLRLKPHPDQNRACLDSLGWQAGETLLAGDSPDDILSAKALSIFSVGVASGLAKEERLREAGADRTIQNLGELPSIIQNADRK
jgi:phosphoglycolate phosphatase